MIQKSPFGEYLKSLRKSKKMSIVELATFLNVSKSYVSQVERGERDVPLIWEKKIIKIFNLNENERKELKRAIVETPVLKKISLEQIQNCLENAVFNLAQNKEDQELLLKRVNELIDSIKSQQTGH